MLELTWLGQSGVLLATAGIRVLIDPFLSDHAARAYPPPCLEVNADWLLVTHEHIDHLDRDLIPRLRRRSPQLRLLLPAPICDQVSGLLADDRIIAVEPGTVVELNTSVAVEVVAACHGATIEDGYSDHDGRFLGYVLQTQSGCVYHGGDTILTERLLDSLARFEINVALLPVNGRDFVRERLGLVGNLNVREAVWLATQLGASVLVPMHWDLFRVNAENPGRVADEAVAVDAPLHVLVPRRFLPIRLAFPATGRDSTRSRWSRFAG